ncbi:MAG: hypothetical protein GY699_14970 [Desulfobacteraceae bacterium]|nr:hypothetical protein [Desulfobacteraceae bacterium]
MVSNVKNKISRNKAKKGMPEVKTPEKLDNKGKKDYSNSDKEGAPKTEVDKPRQPKAEEIYPPRTDKAIRESKHVATEMDNVISKRKNPSSTVFTHEDGSVSVGISGQNNTKTAAQARKLEDHLNKDLETPKYRVSGESMPADNLNDIDGGNIKGVCSEPKAANAAHNNPSSIDGFDSRWRGNKENPHPYTRKNADNVPVDQNQMEQCLTCADHENAKEYMKYANNHPEE